MEKLQDHGRRIRYFICLSDSRARVGDKLFLLRRSINKYSDKLLLIIIDYRHRHNTVLQFYRRQKSSRATDAV